MREGLSQSGAGGGGDTPYTAIVLAGKRPGIDPVAAAHGVQYKALVSAFGRPMITRVVQALCQSHRIRRIIVVTDEAIGRLEDVPGFAEACQGTPTDMIATGATISESVIRAIEASPESSKFLVTTADHPLLTSDIVEHFLVKADQVDGLAVGLVERAHIESGYPGMRRTYVRFRGSEVSGANLFALNGREGIHAVRFWASIEADRKKPWKLLSAFGFFNMIGASLRLFSLSEAFRRASKVLGCTTTPILLDQPEAAIDVDKLQDLLTVDGILARRSLAMRAA